MTETPVFPPLLTGVAVTGRDDPFEAAQTRAALGCDGGTLVYNLQADRLRAAIVFAPEVALQQAMAMLPACGVGFQNALGALAPPEVAVHLTWDGAIRVNGAGCGRLDMAASTRDPAQVPDWLVVGLDLPILRTGGDPGATPDVTALYDEGCTDVDLTRLLESWARHTLVWINRWSEEGNAPLHDAWIGLLEGVGEDASCGAYQGRFLGVDEDFGMLLRDDDTTHLCPLSLILKETA